jgi:Repeat of unknown function (DUF346)
VLDGTGGRLRKLDPAGKLEHDFGRIIARPPSMPLMPKNVSLARGPVPALGTGWIVYGSWTNTTGNPITSFTTTWTVPPEPSTHSGQTIFLFNAIQNSTMIFQPVLQWGKSGAGGGDYWAVASWYADGTGGVAFYSSLERVAPGDVLVGIMSTGGPAAHGLFSYNSYFHGIAHTHLHIKNVEQLTWCTQTLEAYGVKHCSDYPNTAKTAMRAIGIKTGSVAPAIAWTPIDSVTDCNQSAVVVSNSATDGRVDLHYRLWNPWHYLGGQVTSGVSAVSWSADRLDLFVRGTDGAAWHKWWAGTEWGPSASTWESLGGPIVGSVSAVSWAPGRLDLFARASDNSVCHKWFDTAGWGPSDTAWEGLGGAIKGSVSAVSWAPNRLDLFARGTDDAVWHSWWGGAGWGAWESLGGTITGVPAAVSWGPNRLDVFFVGTDGAVWHKWWDGRRWAPSWESLGGGLVGSVAAVSWAADRLDLFARGTDDAVWHKWWNGKAWGPSDTDWESLGGEATGVVSAVSWAEGRLDLFVRDADAAVYHRWYGSSGWGPTDTDWESLGAKVLGPVTAVARAENRLDVFVRETNNAVWQRRWNGSAWIPPS